MTSAGSHKISKIAGPWTPKSPLDVHFGCELAALRLRQPLKDCCPVFGWNLKWHAILGRNLFEHESSIRLPFRWKVFDFLNSVFENFDHVTRLSRGGAGGTMAKWAVTTNRAGVGMSTGQMFDLLDDGSSGVLERGACRLNGKSHSWWGRP